MRIEKGGISRNIDVSRIAEYKEKGYAEAEKPKGRTAKGDKNGQAGENK